MGGMVGWELPAVFVEQAGDEKDVMNARKQGEGEDGCIDRGKVIAGAEPRLRRQHYDGHSDDLYEGADFPGKRWLKRPEAGDHIDGGRADQDKDVATDHGDGDPERNRQV